MSEASTDGGLRATSANDLLARMARSGVGALAELSDRTSALAYQLAHGLTGDAARAAVAVEAAYREAVRRGWSGENGSSLAGCILDRVERRARATA